MMKQYRINKTTTFVEDNRSGNEEYAKNCANELLEKLNEKI